MNSFTKCIHLAFSYLATSAQSSQIMKIANKTLKYNRTNQLEPIVIEPYWGNIEATWISTSALVYPPLRSVFLRVGLLYSHNLTIVMSAKDYSGAGGLVGVRKPPGRAIKEERRGGKEMGVLQRPVIRYRTSHIFWNANFDEFYPLCDSLLLMF